MITKNKTSVYLTIILAASLLFTANAFAAPAPHGIAVNEQEKTCANYWAGDEVAQISLPDNWQAYYPEGGGSGFVTSLGSCKITSSFLTEITSELKSCMKKWGCAYVGYSSFKKEFRDLLDKDFSCVNLGEDKFWGVSVIINSKSNQCALATCSGGQTGVTSQKYATGPEIYKDPQPLWSLKTKDKSCSVVQNRNNDFTDCCNQLGYKFIKDVNEGNSPTPTITASPTPSTPPSEEPAASPWKKLILPAAGLLAAIATVVIIIVRRRHLNREAE